MSHNWSEERGHPLRYIFERQVFDVGPYKRPIVDFAMRSSGFDGVYRKNLMGHFGCINAIEFSDDGSLLVSGGDDRRILLWKMHKAIVGKEEPRVMDAEHSSNVFALSFNSSNSKVLSAGNDDQVIVHDIATGVPVDYFVQEQPIFGVSSDPLNDSIFCTAGDDGKLFLYDIRESSSEPLCLAKSNSKFHSVMFHPRETRLLVSANAKEGVALWDLRMPLKSLIQYGRQTGQQCCMGARFNRDGSQVLALRRRLPPILYSTYSRGHMFQFNHPSYYNSCTMKSCCFGGPEDQFVIAGSDNFDVHIWKIPVDGSNRWINEASLVLNGHRSIVNQVRYNYAHDTVASAGVEKMIKIWSPFPLPVENLLNKDISGIKAEASRRVYSHEEYIRLVLRSGEAQFPMMTQDPLRKTIQEDTRMMAFFDALVQRDITALSEDEREEEDSNYTNTVYSSKESSSDDADPSEFVTPSTSSDVEGTKTPTTSTSQSQSAIINLSQLETEEPELSPRLVSIEDLPVIQSDSEDNSNEMNAAIGPELEIRRLVFGLNSSTFHVLSVNEDLVIDNPTADAPILSTDISESSATEPNRLTCLIKAKECYLRRLAKRQNKFEGRNCLSRNLKSLAKGSKLGEKRRKRKIPSTSSSSEGEDAASSGYFISINRQRVSRPHKSAQTLRNIYESNQSNESNSRLESPVRLPQRNPHSTPVYDRSNNDVTPNNGENNYQLVKDLMTRPQRTYSNNSSASSTSSSSSTSTSSSSESESSESDSNCSRATGSSGCVLSKSHLDPGGRYHDKAVSKKRGVTKMKTLSSSFEYSTLKTETRSKSSKASRKRRRMSCRPRLPCQSVSGTQSVKKNDVKVASESELCTPSDSGIEMSKTNEPGCSKNFKNFISTTAVQRSDNGNLRSRSSSSD